MNKSQLVDKIVLGCSVKNSKKNKANITKAEANEVLDVFMNTVKDALKAGDKIVLTGFGSFETGNRPERKGRDPRTGKPIVIRATRYARFKVGKGLKDAVQQK